MEAVVLGQAAGGSSRVVAIYNQVALLAMLCEFTQVVIL